MFRILHMTDWGVKRACQHELLIGKKPIARGCFSAIFDGRHPSRVLKLTTDKYGYWMLNCYASKVTHWHFPRVHENFGEIGEMQIGKQAVPLYLFEMERLRRLPSSGPVRRVAHDLWADLQLAQVGASKGNKDLRAMNALQRVAKLPHWPRSLRNAAERLANFCSYIPGGLLDLHVDNFMQRANGELVIVDPLMDEKLYDLARGW